MKYSEKDLFDFMDSKRPVKVTATNGKVFTGMCWAYSAVFNDEEDGVMEPSLEIGNTALYLSEIEKIEYM